MRRFLLILLAAALLGGIPLSLYLRDREPPGSLPSLRTAEVMELAAQKSRALQSARLSGHGNFRLEEGVLPVAGTVELNGVLQDAGDSVDVSLAVDALLSPETDRSQTFRLQGAGNLIVAGRKELYFKIESITTEPESSLFQPELIALLVNQWWMMPSTSSAQNGDVPGGMATPSPGVLRAQAQVVRVTEDRGIDSLDGAPAYHFAVAIDPVKLLAYLEEVAVARKETLDRDSLADSIADLQATGELWIDEQSYVLRKVMWDVQQLKTGQGRVSGSFTVELSEFDSAPPVSPPSDSKPFSPAAYFGLPSGASPSADTLSPAQIEQVRSLTEGDSGPTE